MKWGVRKKRSSFDLVDDKSGEKTQISYNPKKLSIDRATGKISGTRLEARRVQKQIDAAKSKHRQSDDYREYRSTLRKPTSELTSKELKRLNERLQLEKTNRELTMRSPLAKIKVGTAAAGTILAVGATANQAIQFASSPAGQSIKKALVTAMNK